jgi:hypothetical protein
VQNNSPFIGGMDTSLDFLTDVNFMMSSPVAFSGNFFTISRTCFFAVGTVSLSNLEPNFRPRQLESQESRTVSLPKLAKPHSFVT